MRFLFFAFVILCFQCSKTELNNPKDFESDSFRENETLLCLTGQSSFCQAAIPVCTICRFFSTSITYNGNRGGISGADAKCMSDSKKPTEPARAVFKAFLVDDVNRIACTTNNCVGGISEHVDWILKPNTNYVRAVDGGSFAITNSAGIFTSQLQHAENPTIVTSILTGLDTSGWDTRSGQHCNRWTDGTGTGNAGVASSSVSIFSSTLGNCNDSSVIFCVEQ
ncbi:MAG: DUF1554 domain-containing protein [Leptospira bouyouniensis]|uniref:DUF1554 domain-containing protein n=1 Tax=Leptospira bouyouniensis TaxID=2484911 RepID=A0A7I0HUP0_9LEPT|nr:DUF1554 domain-containing protein [Leptospira bouyouniensis]TGL07915.1 DUF1554 domain-containing protein [Leptospira bouyouniensis]